MSRAWLLVAFAGIVLLAFASGAAAAPPDAVRVGGPSRPGDRKVALVVSSATLVGQPFTVVDAGGRLAGSGTLAPVDGRALAWPQAAAADLTGVREPGEYRVRAAGLESQSWIVARKPESAAIRAMLGFFAANSDGRERSPAHGPAHLNDAVIASGRYKGSRFDLTGGWMDAGDMLKFVQTTGFAAAVLQAAARLDPADARALNAAADVGVRWLVKAHPKPDLFVAQVGDLRDHEPGFRAPDEDDRSGLPGIATRLAYPAVSGDLAGKAAAALALAADRAGGQRRALLLGHARAWYDAGKKSRRATPQLPGDAYKTDTWRDDLAAGAAALYRTTREERYAVDAVTWLRSGDGLGITWHSFAGFAAADLCGRLGAPPAANTAARTIGCARLAEGAAAASEQAADTAFGTPGPFGWGQTAENGSGGALAALGGRRDVAVAARDWLLGRNPWDASFVVGYGRNPARHPHHWATLQGPGKPVGAVVGGPADSEAVTGQGFITSGPFDTDAAVYEDRADNYVTSEPALDYTAASILLLAALAR